MHEQSQGPESRAPSWSGMSRAQTYASRTTAKCLSYPTTPPRPAPTVGSLHFWKSDTKSKIENDAPDFSFEKLIW